MCRGADQLPHGEVFEGQSREMTRSRRMPVSSLTWTTAGISQLSASLPSGMQGIEPSCVDKCSTKKCGRGRHCRIKKVSSPLPLPPLASQDR